MYSIRFVNVSEGIDLTIDGIKLQGINEDDFLMGNDERAIDGTLISYNDGYKKDLQGRLQLITVAEKVLFQQMKREQLTMVVTITDDYLETQTDQFNALITDFDPPFENFTRLYAFNIRIREL